MKQLSLDFDPRQKYYITVDGDHWQEHRTEMSYKKLMSFKDVNCEKLGICDPKICQCDTRSHPLLEDKDRPGCYHKLCIVVFHDAEKPEWNIEDLI